MPSFECELVKKRSSTISADHTFAGFAASADVAAA